MATAMDKTAGDVVHGGRAWPRRRRWLRSGAFPPTTARDGGGEKEAGCPWGAGARPYPRRVHRVGGGGRQWRQPWRGRHGDGAGDGGDGGRWVREVGRVVGLALGEV